MLERRHNNRGAAHGAKGEYDRAIADFDKAIEINPKYARAYFGRGGTYAKKGGLDEAIANFDKAIEIDPKFAPAYFGRGTAYGTKGDLDRAIADYDKAIQINPKYAGAYNSRGDAYGTKGDLDRAIADYSKAIELDPKDAWAYPNRGNTYAKKGEYDRAIADYSKAIELHPKDAWAYPNRGNTYAKEPAARPLVNDRLSHSAGVSIGIECSKSSIMPGVTLNEHRRGRYRLQRSVLYPQKHRLIHPIRHTISTTETYRPVSPARRPSSAAGVETPRRLRRDLGTASKCMGRKDLANRSYTSRPKRLISGSCASGRRCQSRITPCYDKRLEVLVEYPSILG